jgi:chromosomal replication initiation ATPase DnaA
MPAICHEFRCTHEVILQKGRKGNLARDLAIYYSPEMTAESGVALGRTFGISGVGITTGHDYIAEKIEKDRDLKKRVKRIRKIIVNN